MQNETHAQVGLAHEFMTCGCQVGESFMHETCCATPATHVATIGKKWATPLSGFIAGAALVTIMMAPWMLILGKEAR